MQINGVAHVFITAGDFERSRDFYRQLLPFLGMKPVMDAAGTYYCVGGRTGFGVRAPRTGHEGPVFTMSVSVFANTTRSTRRRRSWNRSARTSSIRRRMTNGRRDTIRCCSRTLTACGSR
jgi:hypothetical protein